MKTTFILIAFLIMQPATVMAEQDMSKQDSSETGMMLEWIHFIGGSSGAGLFEQPVSVLEPNGILNFAGVANSRDFPTTPDAMQMKLHGGNDVFLLALNVNNNSLAYGSYLGGSSICLACDENGTLYAIGNANSEDFPIGSRTTGATGIQKDGDIFIAKFKIKF